MKTLNTKELLPTTSPPQDITAAGYTPDDNSDLKRYGMAWRDFYVVLEDARGATQSFEDVEFELYGYINDGHTPALISSYGPIDSDEGTLFVPVADIPDVQYLYAKQSTHDNLIGPTGPAAVTSTNAAPFNFVAGGKTLIISIDGAADDTATFDAAAAALTSGNAETYAIADQETVLIEIDEGDEQTVTFETAGAQVVNVTDGPWDLSDGQTLTVDIDGAGAATCTFNAAAGTLTSGNAETYAITNGQTLLFAINGGSEETVTFATAAGTVTSGNTETFSLSGTETLLLKVDGGGEQTVTFLLGDFATPSEATAAEAVIRINADTTGLTATAVGGAVVLTSDTVGTSSSVQVTGGTGNAGILAFDTDLHSGSGDFVDASAATAVEIATAMTAALTGCTISGATASVVVTSEALGTGSSVKCNGGTANTALAFSTTIASGTGDAVDASAVTATELAAILNSDVSGQTSVVSGDLVIIVSDTTGTDASVEVTGGTMNATVGYPTDIAEGTGDFADASAATAVEVAAAMTAALTGCTISGATASVVVTSDTIGTDSHVKCNGGTANTAIGFSTTIVDGTGDVADVTAVTGAEIKTVVEADVADSAVTVNANSTITIETGTSTGASASIQVQATSTADTIMGLDNTAHAGPTDLNPACKYILAWTAKEPTDR